MKTNKKLNPRFFVFAALLMVVAIAALPRTTLASATQQFNVPLTPFYSGLTPANYLYGQGNWTGTVRYGTNHVTLSSQVTLVGAEPMTWFTLRLAYIDPTGTEYMVYRWTLFTDSSGNGFATIDSKVPSGAVAVVLSIYDATHFNPPLKTMTSDPDLGGDDPTED